jgi:hypothetical protein
MMKLARGKKQAKEKPEPVFMQIEPSRAGSDAGPRKPMPQKDTAPEPDSEPEMPKRGGKAPKPKRKESMEPAPVPEPDFQEAEPRERPAGSGPIESHVAELRERVDEIEAILEKMSERLKESGPGAQESGESGGRISDMEDVMKVMKDRILSMGSRISELEQKSQAQEPQAPESGDVGGRLDTFDSRIAGVTDKLTRLSEDMQKLTSYFMDGMKHVESRIMEMESEKASQPQKEENKLTPSSFRSRIKREFGRQDDYPPRSPEQEPETQAPRPPPAPLPDRGNVFTRLREGTVVRRPMPSRDPERHDLEVLMEHIRESARKRESREKIRRDLLNAGFDPNLIAKAFMMLRAG